MTPSDGEVANLGWLRPPLIYLCSIACGLLLHLVWPLALIPGGLGTPLGVATVVAAVALFVLSARRFRVAGTPLPGNRPTTAIVRTGPYRFSRNPVYLSFSLLQLGIASWADSLWLVVTLVPTLAVMTFVVIPREERYLQERFPSEYGSYRASVRRWL